jgi:hypothetical protein
MLFQQKQKVSWLTQDSAPATTGGVADWLNKTPSVAMSMTVCKRHGNSFGLVAQGLLIRVIFGRGAQSPWTAACPATTAVVAACGPRREWGHLRTGPG